jgi:hypothetical protein
MAKNFTISYHFLLFTRIDTHLRFQFVGREDAVTGELITNPSVARFNPYGARHWIDSIIPKICIQAGTKDQDFLFSLYETFGRKAKRKGIYEIETLIP